MMKGTLLMLALCAAGAVGAEPSRSPMEWKTVSTNEIAAWKRANRAPDGLVVDAAAKRVRFLAEATGLEAGDTVEFFAIGPLSDRAYESLFVSVARPADLAAAFDRLGVPRGKGVEARLAQFWPQGEKVRLDVRAVADGARTDRLDSLLKDVRLKTEGALLDKPLAYTAGARDAAGAPVAETNMPCAIFALYNHGPSLFQFDGLYEQSAIYGRFVAARTLRKGALYELTATWDGVPCVEEFELTLTCSNAVGQVARLRAAAERKRDVFARLAFDPSVTLEEAERMAQAFATLDGAGVKMNGAAPGQFFFRAFLPDPAWRARPGRVFQPFEVHIAADGAKSFTFVEEDWSGEGLDPVLKPKTTPFRDWRELPALIAQAGPEAAKISVLFLFAPKTARVSDLTPILSAVRPRITTFYVFGEPAS